MKDAPINLPPLPETKSSVLLGTDMFDTFLPSQMFAYARAAVLADRSGREHAKREWVPVADWPEVAPGVYAAPSPAEPPKYQMCTACSADSAGNYWHAPGCPNAPAEPPAAPVQQEPVAWMTDDGESFWSGPDPMTEPGWIALYAAPPAQDVELLRAAHDAIEIKLNEKTESLRAELAYYKSCAETSQGLDEALLHMDARAKRAEAERDSLRALLQEARDRIPELEAACRQHEENHSALGYRCDKAEASLADARNSALEEAAKVCDELIAKEYATGKVDHNETAWSHCCGAAIRALRIARAAVKHGS